jgi:hypothetical protein
MCRTRALRPTARLAQTLDLAGGLVMLRTLGLIGALALAVIRPEANTAAAVDSAHVASPETCCKHCHKGKACGNTCVAREVQCHRPPGCACDSWFDDQLSF